jgi:NAD(P)-dependent dehydrogenase (short-subunit alcohol dehydrogenase family)
MALTAAPRSIPRNLIGQKALVTGANSGIGRAVAVAVALGEAGAATNVAMPTPAFATEWRRIGSNAAHAVLSPLVCISETKTFVWPRTVCR